MSAARSSDWPWRFFFFKASISKWIWSQLCNDLSLAFGGSGNDCLFGCWVHFCSRALSIDPLFGFLLFWLWLWSRSTLPGSSENTKAVQVGRRENIPLQTQLFVHNAHWGTLWMETSLGNKPWGSVFFSQEKKGWRGCLFQKHNFNECVCVCLSHTLFSRERDLYLVVEYSVTATMKTV